MIKVNDGNFYSKHLKIPGCVAIDVITFIADSIAGRLADTMIIFQTIFLIYNFSSKKAFLQVLCLEGVLIYSIAQSSFRNYNPILVFPFQRRLSSTSCGSIRHVWSGKISSQTSVVVIRYVDLSSLSELLSA
ncbi:10638_t:CDS:2 [Funneliformis mosseae]|uniref:10638_t:CDS:1 n=1 Tax=Funneliformis mosseae TaxID=27381 RepID=A0A9N9ATD7_FUNMO|nr:10638_t:CDS:2 [Funneliformis mosseae]